MVTSVWDTPLGQKRLEEMRTAANDRAAAEARRVEFDRQVAAAKRLARGRRAMQSRMYAAAKSARIRADWHPSNSSADAELVTSLQMLRARSRELVRDSGYAKRAKVVVVNNVIGPNGIGLQAQVKTNGGDLIPRYNGAIEEGFAEWSERGNCHTGGGLHFTDFERQGVGQVFEAGEVFVREHFEPFGPMGVPYALELIEAERIADEFTSPAIMSRTGNEVRMGVEMDRWGRPVAYYIRQRHPNEVRWGATPGATNDIERVPADQIIHLRIVDRWPQTRGEPWLHATARDLLDMEGYVEAEITRARVQASTVGAIETPEDAENLADQEAEDGEGEVEYQFETEPGLLKRLNPGEKLSHIAPSSPNPNTPEFMRHMIRKAASGSGVSYESISRDYSQSNYSSSKLALLEDRDNWRCLQFWFIREFRQRVHRRWLQQAVFSRKLETIKVEDYAANMRKYEAVRYKPRGWTWVDPTKEVKAFKEAVAAGFTTLGEVIAATGGGLDFEDITEQRAAELKRLDELGLVFDTSPAFYMAKATEATKEEKPDVDDEEKDDDTPPGERRVVPFSPR